jgi:hypothetical protein
MIRNSIRIDERGMQRRRKVVEVIYKRWGTTAEGARDQLFSGGGEGPFRPAGLAAKLWKREQKMVLVGLWSTYL